MKKLAVFLALSLIASTAFAFPKWVEVGIGSHDVTWTGGSGTLSVAGTFGGATVTFFYCAPLTGLTQCFEVDATACTFTAAGTCDFFKGPGDLQLVVAGGTPSITAVAAGPTQASSGSIGGGGGGGTAIAIDADQDGNNEIFLVGPQIEFDINDDAATNVEWSIDSGRVQMRMPGNNLIFRIVNTDIFVVDSGGVKVIDPASGLASNTLRLVQVTATVPGYTPLLSDSGTGVGRDTVSGGLSLIDNSVEGLRVLSTEVLIPDGLRLGIGVNDPKALLHIVEGGSTFTPSVNTKLLIQSNNAIGDSTFVSILAGNAGTSQILFGDVDRELIGRVLYDHADNHMAFFSNDAERVRIDSNGDVTVVTTTAQLLLPSSNDAVTPTLAFGDGDTGLYEASDDSLSVSTAGSLKWSFSAGGAFFSTNTSGPQLRNISATATTPTIHANRASLSTGIGGISGEVSVIVAATEILNASSGGVAIGAGLTFAPPPDTSPPITCDGDSDGHLYDDTDQDLLCRCDGTTWAGVGGGATCT